MKYWIYLVYLLCFFLYDVFKKILGKLFFYLKWLWFLNILGFLEEVDVRVIDCKYVWNIKIVKI